MLFLAEGENVIGRDPGCNVWLDVPGVSRRHARVVVSGDAVVVEVWAARMGRSWPIPRLWPLDHCTTVRCFKSDLLTCNFGCGRRRMRKARTRRPRELAIDSRGSLSDGSS